MKINNVVVVVLCFYALPVFAQNSLVCPNGGRLDLLHRKICCKDGFAETLKPYTYEHTGIYDTIDAPSCGCPAGGVRTQGATIQIGCCSSDHYGWDNAEKAYTAVHPAICGCPEGGGHLSVKMQGSSIPDPVCCKDGYAFNTRSQTYTDVNVTECGCPKGGIPIEYEAYNKYHRGNPSKVCCKDGYNINDKGTDYTNIAAGRCGCPEGWTYQKEHDSCCRNGYRILGKGHTFFQPEICGCPDGGVYQNDMCILDGHKYNQYTKKYEILKNP